MLASFRSPDGISYAACVHYRGALKAGGYFITLDVCRDFADHFHREEARKIGMTVVAVEMYCHHSAVAFS